MKSLTAILLLVSITGIFSAFKLDVNVSPATILASDAPTSTNTMNKMFTAVKAATDCAVSYAEDINVVSDYLYNKCLDDNCARADTDW